MVKGKRIDTIDISFVKGTSGIDFIDDDFAIFSDIGNIPFFDYPTRCNTAVVALCLSGFCRVNVDLKEYMFCQGNMLITMPGQIVQRYEGSPDFKGIFIVVSRAMLSEVISGVDGLLPVFFYISEHPLAVLSLQDMDCLMEYHSFLWKKVKMAEHFYKREVTGNLLRAFLYEIQNILSHHVPKQECKKTRKEELFELFIQAVSECYQENRSVIFYAGKLCVTPKHLSEVVKEISGNTAGEWIDRYVLLEAKALLKSTSLTIQEITEKLNFANQSFFGKYFRQKAGMTPGQYRRK